MLKIILVITIAAGILVAGFKYELQINNEELCFPCAEYPDNFFTNFMTWPENVTLLPDDTIFISGDIILTHDFQPTKKYPLDLEIFKWQRGTWQKTEYTIRRDDYCVSLFDPTEPWRPFVKNFPADQHVCPFKKGQIFSFDNYVSDKEFNLPFRKMEGDYNIRFTVGNSNNLDDFLCTHFYVSLYRA